MMNLQMRAHQPVVGATTTLMFVATCLSVIAFDAVPAGAVQAPGHAAPGGDAVVAPPLRAVSPAVSLGLLAFLPAPPVATDTDVASPVPPAECLVLSKEVASDDEHECANWKVDSEIEETDTGYAITVTACRLTDEREETTSYEGGVDAGGVAKVTRTVTRTICVYGDDGECGEISAADSQTRNLVQ